MDALEQKLKEKLLEGLIEHMDDKMGHDLGSKYGKGMEVSVAAPDKEGLTEGLDHAKDLASHGDVPMPGHGDDQDEGSDEDRLMELLGGHDDDEDEEHA